MSAGKNIEQRKKLLEEALVATDNYEKSLKQIEKLNKRLTMTEDKNKQADKLIAENIKLKEINKTLKETIGETEKRCKAVENEVKLAFEKTSVLKAEIHKKDLALNKYKSRSSNGDNKGMDIETSELRQQLKEKDKFVAILKEELSDRERLFAGADSWNQKCSNEKKVLVEEIKKLKQNNCTNADAFGKIISLEGIIADRDQELKSAKDLNEQLAVHIYNLEAKVCEIPKLEGKIRILEMELETQKKKNDYESMFSMPPPSLISHPMTIPPPPFAKNVEPPMKNQLSDLEKQMQAVAMEISRMRQYSNGADKFNNNGKMP